MAILLVTIFHVSSSKQSTLSKGLSWESWADKKKDGKLSGRVEAFTLQNACSAPLSSSLALTNGHSHEERAANLSRSHSLHSLFSSFASTKRPTRRIEAFTLQKACCASLFSSLALTNGHYHEDSTSCFSFMLATSV
ncbi:MAG: hypothetical protein DRP27_01300 [Thermotogae bacterium]|nr:MAG: hypothetical protein DRP27_01300 [Thermotogota bacterium]